MYRDCNFLQVRLEGSEMITNIDVTLRDGGYRNSFGFSLEYAVAHAALSVSSGVDWVEIGYRKGSYNPNKSKGLTGFCENFYIESIAETVGSEHVGIMVHPHNLEMSDLQESYSAGARLVRVCLSKDLDRGLECAEQAVQLGYKVCVNAMRVSNMPIKRIQRLAQEVSNIGANAFYLADSNGSLDPLDFAMLVNAIGSVADISVGVHTHNHRGLALSNTISAVDAGATWVDSAVRGVGKGAGNLIMEQWITYLVQHRELSENFDFGHLLELSDMLATDVPESAPQMDSVNLLMGYFNLPVECTQQISTINDYDTCIKVAKRLSKIGQ